jgi:hypothetical protein
MIHYYKLVWNTSRFIKMEQMTEEQYEAWLATQGANEPCFDSELY